MNKSPFMAMKTHGLVLDEGNDKMSKSFPSGVVDPEDLLKGTEKLNGQRSHGYGTDVLRLWAAKNDRDTNFGLD